MNSLKIVQAAFQGEDGTIIGTGCFHDTNQLTEDFLIKSEGFITEEGKYLTREQATKLLNAEHMVQSEELDLVLEKTMPTFKFPKLGFPDDRRETPIINDPQAYQNKIGLMGIATFPGKTKEDLQNQLDLSDYLENRAAGAVARAPNRNLGFAMGNEISKDSFAHNNTDLSTKLHEDFHMIMNRIGSKYGHKARQNLARNLYNSLPREHREELMDYAEDGFRNGKPALNSSVIHEEYLAHMLNYLNDPYARSLFHLTHGDDEMAHKAKHFFMKDAYKMLNRTSKDVDENWLKPNFVKSESEDLEKARPPFKFPKMGFLDNRRETYIVNTPSELNTKTKLIDHTFKQNGIDPVKADTNRDKAKTQVMGATSPFRQTSYAIGPDLFIPEKQHLKNSQNGIKHHEDFHMMMNRIGEKHGPKGRAILARNLVASLPARHQGVLISYVNKNTGADLSMNHEEQIGHMITYLNSPEFREVARNRGPIDLFGEKISPEELDSIMKESYSIINKKAKTASDIWAQKMLPKKELNKAEEELEKFQTPPTFPKLGFPDNRKETPIANTADEYYNKTLLMGSAMAAGKKSPIEKERAYSKTVGKLANGYTLRSPNRSLSVAMGNNLRSPSKLGLDNKADLSTKHHEDFHMMMNRIGSKYGPNARYKVTQKLMNSLPKEHQDAVNHYVKTKFGGKNPHSSYMTHEENISHLLNYLNSPSARTRYHFTARHTPDQKRAVNTKLKQAFRMIQNNARNMDESWLKSEIEGNTLEKFQTPPTFPNIGIGDDRRETPIVDTPSEIYNKKVLMADAKLGQVEDTRENKREYMDQYAKNKASGKTLGIPGRNLSFSRSNRLRGDSALGQSNNAPLATQQHENLHLLLNRVEAKYGKRAKQNLVHNLWNTIPEENKNALIHHVASKNAGKDLHPTVWHEEHLAHLLNYLNTPEVRDEYHNNAGHTSEQKLEIQSKLKQAHKIVNKAAKMADKKWLNRVLHKSMYEDLSKSEEWDLSDQEKESIYDNLRVYRENDYPEFKAAKFISSGYEPSQEEMNDALGNNEGDYESAALQAYKIPHTEENIKTLREIVSLNSLNKSDIEVAAIPRVVKAVFPDGEWLAEIVRQGFYTRNIKPIGLSGQHSSGTAVVKDLNTDQVYLLKPGSGNLSNALGVKEEQADSSTREVVFSKIANLSGLGMYVAPAELLLMDNNKVAGVNFFGKDYRSLGKLRHDKELDLMPIFNKYLQSGILYKWAVLDYILGQTDRHANNMMMNRNGDVKLIDAGSAFAGPSFSPATDPKSFIPFYLRVFCQRDFKTLTPTEREEIMPKISKEADVALAHWIDNLPEGNMVKLMSEYGINPDPSISRLKTIKSYPGSKSEFIRKFYSNLLNTTINNLE